MGVMDTLTRSTADTVAKTDAKKWAMDRSEALRVVFHALDGDDSGSIEIGEVLHLATGMCQTMSEDDARAWFQEMDKDGDATVDEAEYLEAMLKLTDDLSPQQFEHRIKDLLARTNKEVTDPRWYYHCENNREYLEAEVVPLLESGLNEMMRAIEAERLRVASGKDWDEDGHVPPDWRPIRPLQFLGEYLRENSKTMVRKREEEARLAAEAAAKAEYLNRTFDEMDREQKLRYSFDKMDGDGNGALDFDELVFVCRKINPGKGVEEARMQLSWMDKDGDGQVDQDEYVNAILEIMQDVDEETFVNGVKRVLTAVQFAKADRIEKLKMVFERVDEDDSGELDRDELTKLAVALVPGGDEVKVRKTMKWLDANGDAAVSFEEFKGPMIEATEGLDDDQFDAAVHKLLAAEGEAVEPDPADDLPPKFGAYVTQFPSHAKCKWIGVKRVDSMTRDEKKICVVDCRSPDERAVSIIKDSVPLGDVKFVSFEDNNVEAVAGGADVSAACEGADVVVCVSAVGAEGGIAAPILAEKLEGKVEVRNLVGGIVAWYNAGGEVVDGEGNPVEAVHPGQRRCIGFVTRARKNAFKFPKEEK